MSWPGSTCGKVTQIGFGDLAVACRKGLQALWSGTAERLVLPVTKTEMTEIRGCFRGRLFSSFGGMHIFQEEA